MQKYVYPVLTFLCSFLNQNTFAQWQTYNIGFDDDLTGIVIQEPKVVVAGHQGIYFSNIGINATDWKKLSAVNPAYSLSFSRTKFTHCFSDQVKGKDQVYACGYDTITQKAAVYYINMRNWSVKSIYQGKRNSVINKICYSKGDGKYLGVGSGGVILSFDSTGYNVIECPYTYNLVSVFEETDNYGTYLTMLSKDYLIRDVIKKGIHAFSATYSTDGNLKDALIGYSRIDPVGNSYHYVNGSSIYENHKYDADTLKANCIISFGGYNFVGTNDGVYRSAKSSYNYLEKQPSSASGVNGFLIYKTGLVACCDNGKLIFTGNYGGATKLYTKITSTGACLNQSAYVNASFGSATKCKWYVDGVNVNNSCQSYPQTFKNVKAYDIKLIAENDSGSRDTSVALYYIVNYPNNKIKFSFSDTLLCKEGRVDVKLDSTELNTYYFLKAGFGTGKLTGGNVFGTGATAKFQTGKLTESGTYLIEAQSTKTACSQVLKHKINVKVEKTTAKIYAHAVNVPINDTALFFEHSIDAKNFKWSFTPKPVWYNDSTRRTTAVFNKEGEVKATLICWSDNGCRDTASSTYTNVYNPNYTDPDTCWNLKIHGIDKDYEHHDANAMFPLRDGGFLIDGSSPAKPIYESRKGKGLEDSASDPGYIARYDSKGVLNWVIGKDISPISNSSLSSNNNRIISEDTKGNILVASPKFLRDASGRVLDSDQHLLFAKLNRSGELIFMITTDRRKYWEYPLHLFTDFKDNIYTVSTFFNMQETQLFRNGDSLALLKPNPVMACSFILTKFDSKGNMLWNRPYSYYDHTSEFSISNLEVDAGSNVYISGSTRYQLISCDPKGSDINTISGTVNSEAALSVGYLQKLDSNGFFKWSCRAYTLGNVLKPLSAYNTKTHVKASRTTLGGSTFIAGTNYVWDKQKFVFENANGSTSVVDIGDQYLLKVDPEGMVKWIVGTRPNYGYGGYVSDMTLHGEEIVTMGLSANDRFTEKPTIFTSTNGDSIVLDFKKYRWDNYLAHYDTNGVLSKILVSGITSNIGYSQNFGPVDLHKNNSEYFVLAKAFHNPNIEVFSFGNFIDVPADNRPGFVCRFTEDCVITYLPNQSCKSRDFNVKQIKSACDSLISPGGFKYTSSGQYIEKDTFVQNCDTTYRTINLNLRVKSSINKFNIINSCEQFISPSGRVYDSTGLYTEIFTSGKGCDSTIHYEIRIADYENTFIKDTACNLIQLGNGKYAYESGFYLDTFVSKSGCDSFVYSAIVIYEVISNIEIKDSILVCADSSVFYQWFDCKNNTTIKGATNRKFKPSKSGNYSCIIFKNDCYDTSECLSYNITTNVKQAKENMDIKVYPNPATKSLSIELNGHPKNLTVSVFNMSGQLITNRRIESTIKFDLLLPEAEGIYNLHLQYDGGIRVFRIIKN